MDNQDACTKIAYLNEKWKFPLQKSSLGLIKRTSEFYKFCISQDGMPAFIMHLYFGI